MKTNKTLPTLANDRNTAYSIDKAIDELNLIEFSLACCTRGKKTVVYEEPVWDRVEKRYVTQRLTISGSDAYGLPTHKDVDILLACLQISKRQGFRSGKVCFSRYEIIKLLNLPDSSEEYARISTSLRRWKGVTLFSDRAYYDTQSKSWVNQDFNIFDELTIYKRDETRPHDPINRSYFVWNDVYLRNLQNNYVKRLDWQYYLSLKSYITKTLFRFLDKRFYHSNQFEIGLKELCINKLGLSSSGRTGEYKRVLNKAVKELECSWHLRELSTKKRYVKKSKGNWFVRFEKRTKRANVAEQNKLQAEILNDIDDARLTTMLTKRGVGPRAAEDLVSTCSPNTIRTMIEFYDWSNQSYKRFDTGFLVQSIRSPEKIVFPKGFESSEQAARKRHIRTEQQQDSRRERQSRDAEREIKYQQQIKEFENYWITLSDEEKTIFEKEAVGKSNQTLRFYYYRYQGREEDKTLYERYRLIVLVNYFHRAKHNREGDRKPN